MRVLGQIWFTNSIILFSMHDIVMLYVGILQISFSYCKRALPTTTNILMFTTCTLYYIHVKQTCIVHHDIFNEYYRYCTQFQMSIHTSCSLQYCVKMYSIYSNAYSLSYFNELLLCTEKFCLFILLMFPELVAYSFCIESWIQNV